MISTSWSSHSTKVYQTNEDATLSKRSANKAGYFSDPLLKFFCKKLVNRTSLINRVYYYRVLMMRSLIEQFLQCFEHVQICNIGAGYDTSVFVCPQRRHVQLHYVEIDLPEVIEKKQALFEKLAEEDILPVEDINVMLSKTVFVSANLSEVDELRALLPKVLKQDLPTLILAECVLQYIPPAFSRRILSDISEFFQVKGTLAYVAIFDQIEPNDLFGCMMTANLQRRSSELHGISEYGSCEKQAARLNATGWNGFCSQFDSVIRNLRNLNPEEAARIDNIEPFDEHESFVETCCHYCLSIGSVGVAQQKSSFDRFLQKIQHWDEERDIERKLPRIIDGTIQESEKITSFQYKGYGHASVSYLQPKSGPRIMTIGGFSKSGGRTNSISIWDPRSRQRIKHWSEDVISPRIYHAAAAAFSIRTFLPASGCPPCDSLIDKHLKHNPSSPHQVIDMNVLVFGGRGAPNVVFGDTCLFNCVTETWEILRPTTSPCPRFRHAMTTIDVTKDGPIFLNRYDERLFVSYSNEIFAGSVAIFGGITESGRCLNDVWVFCSVRKVWTSLKPHGECPKPRHSHAMCFDSVSMKIYISGGIDPSGSILSDDLECLDMRNLCWSTLRYSPFRVQIFSHTMTFVPSLKSIISIGGVSPKSASSQRHGTVRVINVQTKAVFHCTVIPQACGHQTVIVHDLGALYVIGGGLQCFSFGSVFNESYSIPLGIPRITNTPETITTIDWAKNSISVSEWENFLYRIRHPVLFKSMEMGDCVSTWKSVDFLCEKEGNRNVIVHKLSESMPFEVDVYRMDFIEKNFSYRSQTFSDLVKACFAENNPIYYRSIARHDRKCDFWNTFPHISKHFSLPEIFRGIALDKDRYWQSCLRVSSKNVQLWTHYDIYDNVLCQIVGSKKVLLYPPSAYQDMKMHGSVSTIIQPESDPALQAKALEATLHPGDVLFIPALWFHSVRTLTPSIGINVFWKHLPSKEYTKDDNFGNHDLVSMTEARNRVLSHVKDTIRIIPKEYRMFTLYKISEDLMTL